MALFYKRLNFLSEGFLIVSWFLSELIMEKQWFRGFSSNDFFFCEGKNLKKLYYKKSTTTTK